MDSPQEYVGDLQAQVRAERAKRYAAEGKLEELERQLKEYRSDAMSLNSQTAATAVTALERLEKANQIVDKAVEWREHGKLGSYIAMQAARRELDKLIDNHIKSVRDRS